MRNRLILIFLLATVVPLGLTLWTSVRLLDRSLSIAPLSELDAVSESLKDTGRELYQQARESLARDVAQGRITGRQLTPEEARTFLDRGVTESFELAGDRGSRLDYYVRKSNGEVWIYSRPMGVAMEDLTARYARARKALSGPGERNLRRGFSQTLLVIAAVLWVSALAALMFFAARISRPVQQLTEGLRQVAAGDLRARVPATGSGPGEIRAALDAFNDMAGQLQQARERLILVTRLASWQAVARKMAHEVKNSLTPIRLTMEEIVSRQGAASLDTSPAFLEQAAQIVAEEVNTLERRVRAFSEFAAEPPVLPTEIDVNALLEERIQFLKAAHPEVFYELNLAPEQPRAVADLDLIKGVLTNLLENAAEAASSGGIVRARTAVAGETLNIEIHDSGPGLSEQAKASLFEPSISFKKGGMGLGLSIARRGALLCGGDLQALEGELGGAAFRVVLAAAAGEGV
ncbi:MAG TPA: ATP-binding protein [Bryobacteraceae bacterium]|nr:ATP-binding protein [Bryobacteraceae bacterium]